MKKLLILMCLMLPGTVLADMGVPPNAAETGQRVYTELGNVEAKTSMIHDFTGQAIKSVCESLKAYLKKWDMVIEINPGQSWAEWVDCDKNKTEEDRTELWTACMFAAREINIQGRMQNGRERILGNMVKYICAFNDGEKAKMSCEIGDVSRCVSVEPPSAYHNAWDYYMVACCIISPDKVNEIKADVLNDKISVTAQTFIGMDDIQKKSYKLSGSATLDNFDKDCNFIETIPEPHKKSKHKR